MQLARCILRQRHEAACIGTMDAQPRRDRQSLRVAVRAIGGSAAPVIVGGPGAGRADQQDRGIRTGMGGQHENTVFLALLPASAVLGRRGDDIETARQVRRHSPAGDHRPAAARRDEVRRRHLERRRDARPLHHRLALQVIAINGQIYPLAGRAAVNQHVVAGPVGQAVGIAPHLQQAAVIHRRLIETRPDRIEALRSRQKAAPDVRIGRAEQGGRSGWPVGFRLGHSIPIVEAVMPPV
jgi:hypothetical protein